jgi:hypothetical protein
MDTTATPPPAEYRAHLGIADGLALAPLAGTLAFIAVTGGAADLATSIDEGERLAPLPMAGFRALPYAALSSGAGFVTFAPIAHLVHGRPGAAAASFGARAGLPSLAILLTYAMVQASTPNDGQDHVAPGASGAAVGGVMILGAFAAALLIDYRYLAVRE